jgi:hypothetical protein
MLALPEEGMAKSVEQHNVDLVALTDWWEASVLFTGVDVSHSDVVDVLTEMNVYEDQDFASEIVTDAQIQLELRAGWLGSGSPFLIEDRTVKARIPWDSAPAHSFCLALAMLPRNRRYERRAGRDYGTRGELFERVAEESMRKLGWQVLATGWSRASPLKIADVLTRVTDELAEPIGDLKWANDSANECGLDLVCHLPFPDGRGGKPVFLAQCASGENWESKLTTPELAIWTKLIDFSSPPQKAFMLPFAFLKDEFPKISNRVEGMLLDRYRLLSPARKQRDWVSSSLRDALVSWLGPRVSGWPKADS